MSGARVLAIHTRRPWARPGSIIPVDVTLSAREPATIRVELALLDLDRAVAIASGTFRLRPGRSVRTLRLRLPEVGRRGYGLRAVVPGSPGSVAHGAVEALDGWWQSPRHAAITRYRTARGTAAAVRHHSDNTYLGQLPNS